MREVDLCAGDWFLCGCGHELCVDGEPLALDFCKVFFIALFLLRFSVSWKDLGCFRGFGMFSCDFD